jgi:uncharacterized protein (DUF58 family)
MFSPRTENKESVQTSEEHADEELRALLRRVRAVEIRAKKHVNAHAQGAYSSRFKGRGMAFEESRIYVPGDDPRHVDWNVTARTGEMYVKQFVEERELTLLLAVDVSGSFSFGSSSQTKRQLAAEAAALLAFSAMKSGDKVGLLLFSDRVERLIRPKKGRGHVLRLLREILACKPAGVDTDLKLAFETVTHMSRQRAIVACITDLLSPDMAGQVEETKESPLGNLEKPLKVLARRHDLMILQVTDPLEFQVPDVGLLAVRDAETGKESLIDTSHSQVRQIFTEQMEAEQARKATRIQKLGIENLSLKCGSDSSYALIQFLKRRSKRSV